nr:procyclic form-specific polypeptide B1-alpha-like [Pogona vitticeps]
MKSYYFLFALATLLCQMGSVHLDPENGEPPTDEPKKPDPAPSEPDPEPKEEPPTVPEPEKPEPPPTCASIGGHCEDDCDPVHVLKGTCEKDNICCAKD